jgi:Uma2 family endonuclease
MSAEEFLALGETEQRLELVDGVVVVSPSPMPLHQKIARLIMRQIEDTLPPGAELFHETDVVLARRLVYCPDILAYAPGRLPVVPARLDVPPDLVVEVLSPANRRKDLISKREDYEKHGVGEYWIIEPNDVSAMVLTRQGASLIDRAPDLNEIVCGSIPGIRLDLAAVRKSLG